MKKNYYINTLLKTIRFLILGISVCLIVIAACLVTDGNGQYGGRKARRPGFPGQHDRLAGPQAGVSVYNH